MNPQLRIGASSWTAKGWDEAFYPKGTADSDRIAYYATKYGSVEIDSTFYSIPSPAAVKNWVSKTPPEFVFAAKIPQSITHEKVLENCKSDMDSFLRAMAPLGERLGPLLLQFGYFNKKSGITKNVFLERLRHFLDDLPRGNQRLAVEIRNKAWFGREYLDLLREHRVCAALIDQAWMPPISEQMKQANVFTADFLYVRWLGDRKGMEDKVAAKFGGLVWKERIEDNAERLESWVAPVKSALKLGMDVYGYVNNHYSGYAPTDIDTLGTLLT